MSRASRATMSRAFPHPERQAHLVWFDPGATTGIVVLTVRRRWLLGQGDPGWEGLGLAITNAWFGQVGREPALFNDETGRKVAPDRGRVVTRGNGGKDGFERLNLPEHINERTRLELDVVAQCEAILSVWPAAVWGVESFRLLKMSSDPDLLSPVRFIARLEYLEMVTGARRVPFTQSASTAKTTATDERMRRADLYRPGMRHATDAARHAAVFLRECRADEGLRQMAWPRLFRSGEPLDPAVVDAEQDDAPATA